MSYSDQYQKLTGEIVEVQRLLACLTFRIEHDENVDPDERRELGRLRQHLGVRKLALKIRRTTLSRRMRDSTGVL
ncbi:hypothetical protein FJY93_03120 [Candidatus Kaiserbacteria bacterium]|nr:hypothetical protein [Candidatus Kaiserbacteria bacterium]